MKPHIEHKCQFSLSFLSSNKRFKAELWLTERLLPAKGHRLLQFMNKQGDIDVGQLLWLVFCLTWGQNLINWGVGGALWNVV